MSTADPAAYSEVLATIGLAGLEAEAIQTARVLEADGTPAQASIVRQAFLRLLTELEGIAVIISRQAEAAIKEKERTSRVRPDGARGDSLNDYVGESHPIPGVEGSVGINYEPKLENGASWWWTNEEGYRGNLGRKFIGAFQDAGYSGGSRPNPGEFREHPLLTIGKVKNSGKGTIRRPIPARRFVRDGANDVKPEWHKQVQAARRRFMGEVERALIASQRVRAARLAAPGRGGRR